MPISIIHIKLKFIASLQFNNSFFKNFENREECRLTNIFCAFFVLITLFNTLFRHLPPNTGVGVQRLPVGWYQFQWTTIQRCAAHRTAASWTKWCRRGRSAEMKKRFSKLFWHFVTLKLYSKIIWSFLWWATSE